MRYATITHDLNNLLTAIQGNISLILSNPNLDRECRRRLENIKEYIERSTSLISQILSEQKNNATLPEKKNRPIGIKDINKIIEGQVQLYRPNLEIHHIKAYPEYGEDHFLSVNLSKWKVRRILLNLLTNALQAMPRGGDLYIETKNSKSISTQKPYIRISVRDTGFGMDDAVKRKIFDRYFTTKKTGRGLGLASVKEIVSRCGGKITVESKPGVGTAFTVYLPAQAAKTQKIRTVPQKKSLKIAF